MGEAALSCFITGERNPISTLVIARLAERDSEIKWELLSDEWLELQLERMGATPECRVAIFDGEERHMQKCFTPYLQPARLKCPYRFPDWVLVSNPLIAIKVNPCLIGYRLAKAIEEFHDQLRVRYCAHREKGRWPFGLQLSETFRKSPGQLSLPAVRDSFPASA